MWADQRVFLASTPLVIVLLSCSPGQIGPGQIASSGIEPDGGTSTETDADVAVEDADAAVEDGGTAIFDGGIAIDEDVGTDAGDSGAPLSQCRTVMDCQKLFGARATECVSPSAPTAWCDCGGTPCETPAAVRRCKSFGDEVRDTHPRLLVSTEDLSAWADLRSQQPWSGFPYNYNHLNPTWERPITTKALGAMLGYILASQGQVEGKDTFRSAIINAIDGLYDNLFSGLNAQHNVFTGTAGAVVACMMALDVIYSDPDLSNADRERARSRLADFARWYRASPHRGWRLARLGLLATWSIFEKDEENLPTDISAYKRELHEVQTFPDGSYIMSPGYFSARVGGRLAKTAGFDIVSRAGADSLYCDERMQGLMEWASSFWLTPFGAPQLFGDTIRNTPLVSDVVARMGNYGEDLGQVGKWFMTKDSDGGFRNYAYGSPLGYIYGTIPSAYPEWEPKMPTSMLRRHYGASLWSRRDSREALMGTVHAFSDAGNRDTGHSHQDTGSIHVAGYGEHLIFNSSVIYHPSYPGRAPNGDSWRMAYMQNTVLIGDRRTHERIDGEGLVAGLTGGSVEFGKVDSGDALGNGKHLRSLFFVHSTPGKANGYFVLLDEVRPDVASDLIHIGLHPNSRNIASIAQGREYRAPIDFIRQDNSDGSEAVTIMYGTSPREVRRVMGYHADGTEGRELEYLDAVYSTNTDRGLRAVTVLFPEDGGHAKAAMERIDESDYTGAMIEHGVASSTAKIVDVFLATRKAEVAARSEVSFQGLGVFYRQEDGNVTGFAVTEGRLFDDGAAVRTGFRSGQAINVQVDSDKGSIESPGASVTFYAPGLIRVRVDGMLVGASTTPGEVATTIPAGRRSLSFEFE